MTQLDLDAIEARAARLYERTATIDPNAHPDFGQLTDADVPALAAEIRRLRARVTELEEEQRLEWQTSHATNPHTPRLCKCGHSHHAHTAPAPHSCFAFGKTCPCEAYQQLPHDEAVAQLKRNQQAAADRAAVEAHVVADDSDDPEQCGARHHQHPDTVCTEPAGHYQPTVDPHAGSLILDGRECGRAAWDEPVASSAARRP